ncbi:MAG: acyl-CoA/acyl-ACP dehydrogenase [Candidatus Tectomicrobia bacterium]|nr:acyl-CoA/acyl-ACP dehydrogenase [Candidatus Tectomicrobia bacterium]
MDFDLSDEQRAIRDLARTFAREELIPQCAERDRLPDGADAFPWELVERGSRLGFNTLALPKEYGGAGAGVLTQCVVMEELSAGEPAVSKVYSHNWKAIAGIMAIASEEQVLRVTKDFVKDPRYCLGIAMTEPNTGSDNSLPYAGDVQSGPRLTAARKGDDFILNGMKQFIAMGAQAKMLTIYARTNGSVPWTEGTSAFMLFPPKEGFKTGRLHDKVGLRLYPQYELLFKDVRIPERDLMGEENKVHHSRRSITNIGTMEATATALGIAKRAYELALGHARERVQGGKPIIEHHMIGMMLLDMFTRLEAARTLLWRSAWSVDNGRKDDPKLPRVGKVLAVEALNFITTRAVEIWGGMGVMKEAPVEKLHRDAIQLFHMGNTQQVNLLKALEQL